MGTGLFDQSPITPWRIMAVSAQSSQMQTINMVLEEPLALHVNGAQAAILMRLPGMEKELAAGFCLSEGMVGSLDDILMIHHCGRGLPVPGQEGDSPEGTSRNQVDVRVRPEGLRPEARLEVVRLIRAGCGAVDVDRFELPLTPLPQGPVFDPQVVLGFDRTMRSAQRLHQEVGGVHAAAIFDPQGALVVLCEDVGRHNAVDKALGYCLLRGIPIGDKMLLCSGRLSYEMVTKAIRVGLRLLASVSAPTALAVNIAEQFNLTLVGYLRGSKMSVYTHAERLLGLAPLAQPEESNEAADCHP
jgi:FdhD protein